MNSHEVFQDETPNPKASGVQEEGDRWLLPNFQICEQLGRGSYGTVCKAVDTRKRRPVPVAVKKMANVFAWHPADAKRALREVAILSKLKHENIVKLCDVVVPCRTSACEDIYIVMEACDSDLDKLFCSGINLMPRQMKKLTYTLLCGVNYLHSASIWHRDLKPANCLFNHQARSRNKWSIKICDFGLSRPNPRRLTRDLTDHVVTRFWRAPELILLQKNYTEAIDMWSVGCIFAEILGMRKGMQIHERGPLFRGAVCLPLSPDQRECWPGSDEPEQHDQLNMIFDILGTPEPEEVEQLDGDARSYVERFTEREGKGLEFPGVETTAMNLLRRLLRFSPQERISAAYALQCGWFDRVRSQAMERPAPNFISLDFENEPEMNESRLREEFLELRARKRPLGPGVESLCSRSAVVRQCACVLFIVFLHVLAWRGGCDVLTNFNLLELTSSAGFSTDGSRIHSFNHSTT